MATATAYNFPLYLKSAAQLPDERYRWAAQRNNIVSALNAANLGEAVREDQALATQRARDEAIVQANAENARRDFVWGANNQLQQRQLGLQEKQINQQGEWAKLDDAQRRQEDTYNRVVEILRAGGSVRDVAPLLSNLKGEVRTTADALVKSAEETLAKTEALKSSINNEMMKRRREKYFSLLTSQGKTPEESARLANTADPNTLPALSEREINDIGSMFKSMRDSGVAGSAGIGLIGMIPELQSQTETKPATQSGPGFFTNLLLGTKRITDTQKQPPSIPTAPTTTTNAFQFGTASTPPPPTVTATAPPAAIPLPAPTAIAIQDFIKIKGTAPDGQIVLLPDGKRRRWNKMAGTLDPVL